MHKNHMALKILLESHMSIDIAKKIKYKLKKLPMCKQMERVNFEWPTEEIFQQLPNDVFLKSIEISGYVKDAGTASAIKGTLSTGLESAVFKE